MVYIGDGSRKNIDPSIAAVFLTYVLNESEESTYKFYIKFHDRVIVAKVCFGGCEIR